MRRSLLVLAGLAGLLALAGCRGLVASNLGVGIKGSGVAKTEKRNVGNFKGLDAGGAFQVEVTCRKEAGLEITGDDNLLKYIKTEVRDGILYIKTEGVKLESKEPLRVVITAPELGNFNISGASKVKVADLKAGAVKINLSGASQMAARGAAQSLVVDVSGASRLDGKDLQASKVDVNASGASKADVYASADLQADASGASSVNYYGNPKNVSPKASGASRVSAGS